MHCCREFDASFPVFSALKSPHVRFPRTRSVEPSLSQQFSVVRRCFRRALATYVRCTLQCGFREVSLGVGYSSLSPSFFSRCVCAGEVFSSPVSRSLCPFSLLGTLGEGHSLSSPLSLLQAATQTAKSTLSTKTATHGLQLRKVEIQQAIIYQKWLTNGQL